MDRDFVLSADAGGTFLDLVLVNSVGRINVGKALHTPESPAVGILNAVNVVAAPLGLTAQEVLQRCALIFYGTTVTTNGMIERKGVRTGLLCTRGFEDTLYIGRVYARTLGLSNDELTRYTRLDRPPPIVERRHVRGIAERTDAVGTVLKEIDPDEVHRAASELVADGVEAIGISLLHAYANETNEQTVKRYLNENFPQLHVVASSEIAPVIGEYERTNTTVINAYLGPMLDKHLENLEQALSENGYEGELLIMQSIGGVAPSHQIRRQSVATLLSGPVGGIIGARQIGELIGESNIITTDMGGTSFDVGVIVGGQPQYSAQAHVHRQPLMVPTVDVEAIGAGGGSAVWLDENGSIQVGPQSVGARPGPACYGFGGTVPTVTDADVVLGFLDPDRFSIGDSTASREFALAAFERVVAEPLGISAVDAADAVLQIVNNRMADLVRKATIEKGHDANDFVLLAYGGSGPAHCSAYGAEIGVKTIVVPPYASVFSAYGIAQSDLKHSFARAVLLVVQQDRTISTEILNRLNAVHAQLAKEAARIGGNPGGVLSFAVDMRYQGQISDVRVPILEPWPLTEDGCRDLLSRFGDLYERDYGAGASSPVSRIEFVTMRGDLIKPLAARFNPKSLDLVDTVLAATRRTRPVYWGKTRGWRDTPVIDFETLLPGQSLRGPAVVQMFSTTVPVGEAQSATVDAYRNLIIATANKIGVAS